LECRAVIVLDTHAWIWWVSDPQKLGRAAKQEIHRTTKIGIPAVCCIEVATLAARRRITLDRPPLQWLQDSLALDRVDLLALTPAVAVKAAELSADFPGDPADRLIAATAILHSAVLITKDRNIRQASIVRTAW
jgi:PIN domain nuclease of toxin-antitoxin system